MAKAQHCKQPLTFSDGGPVPTLYATTELWNLYNLQFIQVSVLVMSADEQRTQMFTNIWCLWDTDAEISMILGSELSDNVKEPEVEGYVSINIS